MRRGAQPSHERRVLAVALLSPLPAVLIALHALWRADQPDRLRYLLAAVAVGVWLWGAFALRKRVIRALQTIANLLGALREGDYSVRGRRRHPRDALGEALVEVNTLADTLAKQRTGAAEATALLGKVMAEIDVAIFAFDAKRTLRLCNRAAEGLLSNPPVPMIGASAEALGMADLLE